MDKRLGEANKLENEARKLKQDVRRDEQKKEIEKQSVWEEKENIDVYAKSDYAGLRVGGIEFYFGYEDTFCEEHGTICCVDYCDESEWAFVVKRGSDELMRIPKSKLHPIVGEEMMFYLLAGIGHYLKQKAFYEQKLEGQQDD